MGAGAVHTDIAGKGFYRPDAIAIVLEYVIVPDDVPRVNFAFELVSQHLAHALAATVETFHCFGTGEESVGIFNLPIDVFPPVGPSGPAPRTGAMDKVEVVFGGIFFWKFHKSFLHMKITFLTRLSSIYK